MTQKPTSLAELVADNHGKFLLRVAAYVEASYSSEEAAWVLELAGLPFEKLSESQRQRALARLICASHRKGEPIAEALLADRPAKKAEIERLFVK